MCVCVCRFYINTDFHFAAFSFKITVSVKRALIKSLGETTEILNGLHVSLFFSVGSQAKISTKILQ